jgi:hypothetical protein
MKGVKLVNHVRNQRKGVKTNEDILAVSMDGLKKGLYSGSLNQRTCLANFLIVSYEFLFFSTPSVLIGYWIWLSDLHD